MKNFIFGVLLSIITIQASAATDFGGVYNGYQANTGTWTGPILVDVNLTTGNARAVALEPSSVDNQMYTILRNTSSFQWHQDPNDGTWYLAAPVVTINGWSAINATGVAIFVPSWGNVLAFIMDFCTPATYKVICDPTSNVIVAYPQPY